MKIEEIFALTERIQAVCPPDFKVEIVPTRQPNDVHLIIIQLPVTNFDSVKEVPDEYVGKFKSFFEQNPVLKNVYFWEVQNVRHWHYETILPLLGDAKHFRVLYCCGNKFVAYERCSLFDSAENYAGVFDYLGVKDQKGYRWMGVCRNIDLLIGVLMTTYQEL